MPNEKFGLSNVEKGTTEPDKQGVIWIDDTSGDVKLQYNAGGGTPAYKTLGGSGGSGDSITVNTTAVTDADLNDTTPAAAAGGVNVKWQRSGSGPDSVSAYVQGFGAAAIGAVPASGGGTSNYLRADGTWAAPAGTATNALLDGSKHTDTTAGTVARGDIITGQGASPTWTRLAKGTEGHILTMGANEPAWAVNNAGFHDSSLGYMGARLPVVHQVWYRTAGSTNTATSFVTSGSLGLVSIAQASTASSDYKNPCGYFSAAATNTGGFTTGTGTYYREQYPYFRMRYAIEDNDDGCVWIGFTTNSVFGAAADLTNEYAAFRARNGTDTTWQCITDDNTAQEITDSTVTIDTNFHTFEVWTPDGGTSWKFAIDGTVRATHSTRVIPATTAMRPLAQSHAITSSTRTGWLKSILVCIGDPASTDSGSNQDDIDSGAAGL